MKTQATLRSYILGFIASLVSTFGAYFLVQSHIAFGHLWPSDSTMFYLLGGLALMQAVAQLVWFLHLGRETQPRWKLIAFSFMLLVLVILVVGSIWIMSNLNYHTMSPGDTTKFIIHDEGIQP